ncbi:CPBP family intramembrane metalloprotease [Marixanthomonas sp. SCSIO 43207]|uniref:CPBP family intramembrane glutamic endopeptidase n=1 Tax=Marixanthomonas sp. SCSIO 43207 TaxID=2779360 RepID=UPI001CA82F2A|nr:CPBP family intramembrane glutamic endopeptidase [Marixanthomonas sp. SCSIO 43207]UAB82407.1 CPBP family intramembrane metalloprotease [Marixanthomonas sp. SCSIO 43207]
MKKSIKTILIIIVSFGVYFILDDKYFKSLRDLIFDFTNQFGVSHILTYSISGIPLIMGTLIINKKSGFLKGLGLNGSIFRGFLFALICTLPMYIGFSFIFDFNTDISINAILISVVAASFFEEIFFRGFLFGLIYRKTNLGFIPSVFFGAMYFGILHLYQSTELLELLGIFSITFLGGILFAWVFTEWKFNIWVPIFIHALMNFSWELFSVSENALGGVYSNIFRFSTMGLIIGLTVLLKKKNGLKLSVNKSNLLKSNSLKK